MRARTSCVLRHAALLGVVLVSYGCSDTPGETLEALLGPAEKDPPRAASVAPARGTGVPEVKSRLTSGARFVRSGDDVGVWVEERPGLASCGSFIIAEVVCDEAVTITGAARELPSRGAIERAMRRELEEALGRESLLAPASGADVGRLRVLISRFDATRVDPESGQVIPGGGEVEFEVVLGGANERVAGMIERDTLDPTDSPIGRSVESDSALVMRHWAVRCVRWLAGPREPTAVDTERAPGV